MSLIDQLGDRVRAHAVELARRGGQLTVTDTQAHMSRRTGAMAAGVSASEPVLEDTRVIQQITAAEPYTHFADIGTGIYGPTGARVFPKTAKALRFDSPAAGGIVFARSVAGSPGEHFWEGFIGPRWHDSLQSSLGQGGG